MILKKNNNNKIDKWDYIKVKRHNQQKTQQETQSAKKATSGWEKLFARQLYD